MRKLFGPILLTLALTLACSDGGTLPSPTVRVDLSLKLPRAAQRRLAAADTSYECHRKTTLARGGASQDFIVTWRVFEADEGQRFITAVQVEPDGPFKGARGPRAAALVTEAKNRGVSVRIRWEARQGCGALQASRTVTLHPDDPTCKPPQPAGKIFTH